MREGEREKKKKKKAETDTGKGSRTYQIDRTGRGGEKGSLYREVSPVEHHSIQLRGAYAGAYRVLVCTGYCQLTGSGGDEFQFKCSKITFNLRVETNSRPVPVESKILAWARTKLSRAVGSQR